MHRRPILLMSLALLFSGCSINPVSPPLVVSGHQPAQLPRERGHLACATALYQTLGVSYGCVRATSRRCCRRRTCGCFFWAGTCASTGLGGPRALSA